MFNFNEIGKKIKVLAKVIFGIEVILAILFPVLAGGILALPLLLPIVLVVILFAWISLFALYGFGEAIDKLCDIEMNTRRNAYNRAQNNGFNIQNKQSISTAMIDNATSIGDFAFSNRIEIKNINIPKSVTKIGRSAFFRCVNLTDINFSGTQEEWNKIEKGLYWNAETGNYIIHCTDGDILK